MPRVPSGERTHCASRGFFFFFFTEKTQLPVAVKDKDNAMRAARGKNNTGKFWAGKPNTALSDCFCFLFFENCILQERNCKRRVLVFKKGEFGKKINKNLCPATRRSVV